MNIGSNSIDRETIKLLGIRQTLYNIFSIYLCFNRSMKSKRSLKVHCYFRSSVNSHSDNRGLYFICLSIWPYCCCIICILTILCILVNSNILIIRSFFPRGCLSFWDSTVHIKITRYVTKLSNSMQRTQMQRLSCEQFWKVLMYILKNPYLKNNHHCVELLFLVQYAKFRF